LPSRDGCRKLGNLRALPVFKDRVAGTEKKILQRFFIDFIVDTIPVRLMVNSQGCQMVCFHSKTPNLGIFLRALEWKMLVYFLALWNVLRQFGLFCGHLVILLYSDI
jgi:hypothetical protein